MIPKSYFKHNRTYRLKNHRYNTTFTGTLSRSKYRSAGLTGVDEEGMRCRLPFKAICAEDSEWVIIDDAT